MLVFCSKVEQLFEAWAPPAQTEIKVVLVNPLSKLSRHVFYKLESKAFKSHCNRSLASLWLTIEEVASDFTTAAKNDFFGYVRGRPEKKNMLCYVSLLLF